MDLEEIKSLFDLKVLHTCAGAQVVDRGYCTFNIRSKQLIEDRDLFYVRLKMTNKGKESHLFSFKHFLLSDSDGYFNEPIKSKDYFQSYVKPKETLEGGLLFALYSDVKPVELWFNSGHLYEDSLDAILIKIHLEEEDSTVHTTPMDDTNSIKVAEGLLRKVIEDHRIPCKKNSQGHYLLRLQCPDYRRQIVNISFDSKDDQGDSIVTIFTICAPVPEDGNDRPFLRLNSRLHYATIAIQELNGEEYYTIIARQLAVTCDEKELIKGLRYVSRNGDWLEAELTGGSDLG